MKVKSESKVTRSCLTLRLKAQHSENKDHGIWSHPFMENRWEIMETMRDFIFLSSKITVGGDCSHEIKRHLLLGRKAITNIALTKKQMTNMLPKKLDSTLKSRDITLPTNVHLVKAMVFPVVMYEYESWIIMKAELKN